jgi:PAS domain S-box-containing protein
MSVILIVEADEKRLAKAADKAKALGMEPIAVHNLAEACQWLKEQGVGNEKTACSLEDTAWQSTFDAVHSAVWLLDAEQRVIRCNCATKRIFGKLPEQVLGRHCWEVVHGTSEPPTECPVLRMRKSLRREALELPMNNKWFEVVVDPILDDSGKCTGVVHIVSDISDRKHAEEALHSTNKQLQDALDHVKQLQGILPICMYCHKIRSDQEVWEQLERYITEHSEAKFSHCICPDCLTIHFPDIK